MNRKRYVVSVSFRGKDVCLFESYSVTQACNFIESCNFDLNGLDVHFYREHPFYEFDIKSILEVLND